MSRKHFRKPPNPAQLELRLTLAVPNGTADGAPRARAPSTTLEHLDLFAAANGVSRRIAALLALENDSGPRSLARLFARSRPELIDGSVLLRIDLPKMKWRKREFRTHATLELLKTCLSAHALSYMSDVDPTKGDLLAINGLLNKHKVDLSIRLGEQAFDVRHLGLADRTRAGEDWCGTVALLITETYQLSRSFIAKAVNGLKVQVLLRADPRTFEEIDGKGPLYLMLSGRGFLTDGLLRIVEVHGHERISREAFDRNLL